MKKPKDSVQCSGFKERYAICPRVKRRERHPGAGQMKDTEHQAATPGRGASSLVQDSKPKLVSDGRKGFFLSP